MEQCIACGGKTRSKKKGFCFCYMCDINFDNRNKAISETTDMESLEKAYKKVIKYIETRDTYKNAENEQKMINYFEHLYNIQKDKINGVYHEETKEETEPAIYKVVGIRGRSLAVYQNKIIIKVAVKPGSVITGNATDGEKIIYYKDVIGLQFKPFGRLIGYLQLETASSIMNNLESNFFNENTFTFDMSTITNEEMIEIKKYIDKQLEIIKSTENQPISSADEIRKFKALLDDQIITQEEFDKKKKQLLGF